MSRFFFAVAAARHVAEGVKDGFAMFAHGREDAARKVAAGDWVAYYCPREGLKEGASVHAFTAIGQATASAPRQRAMLSGKTGWSRDMRWLEAEPAGIHPLLGRLSFVTDPRHWGMRFRRSLFAVDEADFMIVAEAMGVADEISNLPKQ